MLYDRIYQTLDELKLSRELKNVHILFRLIMDLFPEWMEKIKIQSELNGTLKDLDVQQRRTDKIRDAVGDFLAGTISKKKLERVFHDTDYSFRAGE